ncbi:hypothetical protein IPL85_05220 [Candidatus Saccharibacteria bacterium]|nr:MAG: hypothetical protein IPL85_05220 [Candidatus Saccharibacteria bacterium]
MARPECPLRFVCADPEVCGKTSIAFETLDGYPSGVVDVEDPDAESRIVKREGFITSARFWDVYSWNETVNSWPMTICDGSGADRQYDDLGNLTNPRDAAWLKRLGDVITGNTWVNTLKDAVDDFPKAPWVDIFQNEIKRAETPWVQARDPKVEVSETPSIGPFHKVLGALGLIDRRK